jgi:S-adenosylmethionine-diacylgycerolhomoserine-N-methlytransferase
MEMTLKNQTNVMDDLYRIQRHFYDATRRFFLPGRDRLLREIIIPPKGKILEVGCGTGRNLIRLGRRRPEAEFFGIDISIEMLRTAERKIRQSRLTNIHIARADAETFEPKQVFPEVTSFDAIFFSYSLLMIPDWRKAIDHAGTALSENGSLYVVDFWDQQNWPPVIRRLFKRWLAMFHVRHEEGMVGSLETLAGKRHGTFQLRSIFGRYAFLASIGRQGQNK